MIGSPRSADRDRSPGDKGMYRASRAGQEPENVLVAPGRSLLDESRQLAEAPSPDRHEEPR